MNAPERTLTDSTFELIPLDNLCVSPLHVQSLRRARFDAESLLQLAANIKAIGVQQPIVVRPVPVKGTVRFEIVCGERRYLAADRAGVGHIPALVRDLTDEQALEIQLSENIERESLHPLEEGQGFRELMDLRRIDAAAVGALFGKSRAYVYSRTKLLDLIPAARDALQRGNIDASKALLLARIHGEKLQAKALKMVLAEGHWYSYQRLFERLREDFMTSLHTAPFMLTDCTLVSKQRAPLPACTDCPHRSGNDAELLAALKGDADICTERACFDLKSAAYWRRLRADAQAAGARLLTGAEAEAAIPGRYETVSREGYVNLDEGCEEAEFPEPEPVRNKDESDEAFEARGSDWEDRKYDWQPPTYRTLIGDAVAGDTVLAEGKGGALVQLAPATVVVKALKAVGIKPSKSRYRLPGRAENDRSEGSAGSSAERQAELAAERAREEERLKVEVEYRKRLLHQIHAKFKGPLKRPDLERIAAELCENVSSCDALDALYPLHLRVEKLSEPDLTRMIALFCIAQDCGEWHLDDKPGRLLEMAQRFKIDAKAIRAQVVKDLKPTAAPKADDTKPAKKKAKK